MLHSYQAELNGSQLIWIDQPPQPLTHQRVVVVVETTNPPVPQSHPSRVESFLNARGCMGRAAREEVLTTLNNLREDWARNPLSTTPGR